MKEKKIGLGFLGAGGITHAHARGLQRLKNVEIVAWSSGSGESARKQATAYGGKAVSEQELLAMPEVDAVLICTPTPLHHEQVLAALAAGKRIFCEKPFARTHEQAEELAAQANGRIYVGHVLRFFHEYRRAREIVQRGDLGDIKHVVCRRLNPPPRGSGDWFHDAEQSGGVLLDLVIHDFDWLLWTFGPAASLTARGVAGKDPAGWRHAIAELRWDSGMKAEVEGSWLHPQHERHLLVEGTRGTLLVGPEQADTMLLRKSGYEKTIPLAGLPDPYQIQMQHFAAWLMGLNEPVVAVADAVAALEVSLQALAALQA